MKFCSLFSTCSNACKSFLKVDLRAMNLLALLACQPSCVAAFQVAHDVAQGIHGCAQRGIAQRDTTERNMGYDQASRGYLLDFCAGKVCVCWELANPCNDSWATVAVVVALRSASVYCLDMLPVHTVKQSFQASKAC